ncbi:MAG TPA: tRNA-dihydrouridine synthase, partial [Chloroflexota bacterium]
VMVGRGATRNPWLVRDLWRAMEGLEALPPPSAEERIELLRAQFELSLEHYGGTYTVPIFRRWIAERARHLGWSREEMLHTLKISDVDGIRQALAPRLAVPVPAA